MTCAQCSAPCQGRYCSACESMLSQEDGLKAAVDRGIASHEEGDDE